MGNCGNKGETKQNTEINKFLKDEKKKMDAEVKLLLLGKVRFVYRSSTIRTALKITIRGRSYIPKTHRNLLYLVL